MHKHHRSSKFLTRSFITKIIWILSVFIAIIGALFLGYFLGFQQAEEELNKERIQTQKLIDQIQSIAQINETNLTLPTKAYTQDEEIGRLKEQLKKLLLKEREAPGARHEYAPKEPKSLPPPSEKRYPRVGGAEAKLVIIIDDVSYERDIAAIRSVGLPLVMSFLPPSPRHPETAQLATKESSYMVHLPMEAVSFTDEEPNTLHVGDSEEKISNRIVELKRLYPQVHYMNNHTGSKFTSDVPSMEKLLSVLKKEGITFVDSRTIGTTKVPQVSKKFGLRYIGRDVFLDHEDGVGNVKCQIREAVEKAKQYGTAIAIGHPRPDTIQALKESKAILSEVKIVGIDKI
ncbi:MAG: divergent polysaccharide deacetylase family protein [Sulfuricurvum sp.]|nr:divergent polysaccharide deacetylase family protein [Sulfuricurvum sp.]MDD5386365.1 divergent polysaccharide deacetylase family protein [Sulfuricurvum sp.]